MMGIQDTITDFIKQLESTTAQYASIMRWTSFDFLNVCEVIEVIS